jgi:NADH:ubiquinone oxidoreductase subunit K
MLPLSVYLMFNVVLFLVGVYACVSKRNLIRIIIGVDILTSAVNLNFIAFSSFRTPGLIDPAGHSFVIILLALEGGVMAVLLSLVIFLHRHYGTLDVYDLTKLKR